jgi:cyclopropane fatty-acyl-phospholipid synthase-like methyltransferase
MTDKPFSESCVQNREPILAVLRDVFADRLHVLEIGSGTGQHAVYFGAVLRHLRWQTADVTLHHPGIRQWLAEAALSNVLPPIALDVSQKSWRSGRYDAVFSANTLHIMSWPEVKHFFEGVGEVLEPGGVLAVYGPFNYSGTYTSESNARFDAWLKSRDPASGVRDFEAVEALAHAQGLVLQQDIAMPANNRTLIWHRRR